MAEVRALDADRDRRVHSVRVAGPAALLVAKLHKIAERLDAGRTVAAKDAHDVYRLLVALSTADLAEGMRRVLAAPVSAAVGEAAVRHLAAHFAAGPDAAGALLAGRAEEGVGDPDVVAASAAALAGDLLEALGAHGADDG